MEIRSLAAAEPFTTKDGSTIRSIRGPGDGILIPPGAWHELRAGQATLRLLGCCAPPYRHEDTFVA